MTLNQAVKEFQATGKKKTAIASVLLSSSEKGSFIVHHRLVTGLMVSRDAIDYFQKQECHVSSALEPIIIAGLDVNSFKIETYVRGGGLSSQASAVRLAVAKALSEMFPEKREVLKKHGFLTRDSRIVERKKPGLRKARRKEQFSKR